MDKIISETANFFEEMTACFGDLSQFEQNILQIAQLANIDLAKLEIDHVAVRMNSLEKAEKWRTFLLRNAKLLKESKVNGRPIGLFLLPYSVDLCGQPVPILELPFPKGKAYLQEGWEHVEAVFPMLETENTAQWIARTLATFNLTEHPDLALKISQPEVEGERLPNPTIAITVKNATFCNHSCLKLHPYGINDIIRSESDF